MNADIGGVLEKFGLPGIVISGLAWFVVYLMKEHKKERQEWQKIQEKQNEEHNKSLNRNTEVLSGLKTLLENRK